MDLLFRDIGPIQRAFILAHVGILVNRPDIIK